MTITVDIKPEIEAEIARLAAAHGLGIREYAASLLEEAAQASVSKPSRQPEPKDMVELFAPVRGFNLDFERDHDAGRDLNL